MLVLAGAGLFLSTVMFSVSWMPYAVSVFTWFVSALFVALLGLKIVLGIKELIFNWL